MPGASSRSEELGMWLETSVEEGESERLRKVRREGVGDGMVVTREWSLAIVVVGGRESSVAARMMLVVVSW